MNWLLELKGGVAYNCGVDQDINAISAGSEPAGTEIVNILAAINPEV